MTTPPPYPQGPEGAAGGYQAPPDNYLVWAILSTVLCCLPLGIVSIVKSAKVNTLWAQGLHDEARKTAEDAKKFAIWSAVAGVVVGVVYGIVTFAVMGSR